MRNLIFVLVPVTLLAAASLAIITVTFDPFKAEGMIKLLFFASLSAFLWGSGTIMFFFLNFFSIDRMTDALRRGFFLALLVLFLVLLKKIGFLVWYSGFAAAIMVTLLEFWIYKRVSVTYYQENYNRDDL